MIERKPHILLLAGTGQNVGKTLLACQLIKNHSAKSPIVGIKISPHFHKLSGKDHVLRKHPNYVIVEERNTSTGKDSARMLEAGASHVFYLQVHDEHLSEAMEELMKQIPEDTPVICESGGLRHIIRPGVFLMIHHKNHQEPKPKAQYLNTLADLRLEFDGETFDQSLEQLEYTREGWILKQSKNALYYDRV